MNYQKYFLRFSNEKSLKDTKKYKLNVKTVYLEIRLTGFRIIEVVGEYASVPLYYWFI